MEATVENTVERTKEVKRTRSKLDQVEKCLTSNEVAEMLRIKPQTLRHWRAQQVKDQPVYIKRNGLVLYRKRDVDEWLSRGAVKH